MLEKLVKAFAIFRHLTWSGVAIAILTALGLGGWVIYDKLSDWTTGPLMEKVQELQAANKAKDEQIAQQVKELDQQKELISRLRYVMTHDMPLARVVVTATGVEPVTRTPYVTIRFWEIDYEGHLVQNPEHPEGEEFKIPGQHVAIRYRVIKFTDDLVEEDKASALFAIDRVYGGLLKPDEGYVVSRPKTWPKEYERGRPMPKWEIALWNRFDELSNNPNKVIEVVPGLKGRAVHYTTDTVKPEQGKVFTITGRASGDITIAPALEQK